ncbi:MAG TPA: hypothetical protein VIG33_16295 [Pseudobdellovibrionaceae bacterium]
MTLKNNKGQALIESLALFITLMATLSVFIGILYFGLVHVGMNYLLHEFLVCKVAHEEKLCHREFEQRAKAFLFAAQVTRFESSRHFNKQKVRVTLSMPMNRRLSMQKELELYP